MNKDDIMTKPELEGMKTHAQGLLDYEHFDSRGCADSVIEVCDQLLESLDRESRLEKALKALAADVAGDDFIWDMGMEYRRHHLDEAHRVLGIAPTEAPDG